MAAPAHQDKESQLVAQVVQVLRGAPETLQAHGVHIHVAHILQLLAITLGCVAQVDIIGPTGTTQQHGLSIQRKGAITLVGEVAFYLANTKSHIFEIRNFVVLGKLNVQITQFGLAHVVAPPQFGLVDMYFGGTHKAFLLARSQTYAVVELLSVGSTLHGAFNGLVRQVA